MRTLAVLSRKGGTGKTTVALHLAMAAWREGRRTLIADMDPQRSALDWRRERQADGPQVIEAKAGALFPARQAAARAGTELMVLDTRPSSDGEAAEAVRFADFCLLVVRPSFFDLRAIVRTVELVANMNRRAMFVLNQAPTRRNGEEPRAVKETAEALDALGLPVCPVGLRYRAGYQGAVRQGLVAQEAEPDSFAAFEINMLWRHVRRELFEPQAKAGPVTHRELVPEDMLTD
jgi:chromosome partitioning protein